jgi:hypothetical protein
MSPPVDDADERAGAARSKPAPRFGAAGEVLAVLLDARRRDESPSAPTVAVVRAHRRNDSGTASTA